MSEELSNVAEGCNDDLPWALIDRAMAIDSGMEPSGRSLADFMVGSACGPCGGQCCKSLPGQFYPADLGETRDDRIDRATALLKTGLYAIDWWDGDEEMPTTYHLRPATKGSRRIFDGSWGGICVFLGDNGCSLPRSDRPTVCKALKPKSEETKNCVGLTKRDVAEAWRADSDWLEAVGVSITET